MRIFLVAAVVLIVFGIIAAAGATDLFLSVSAVIWFMASFLAYLTDCLLGGYIGTAWTNRNSVPPA
jgi:hypothetical protein